MTTNINKRIKSVCTLLPKREYTTTIDILTKLYHKNVLAKLIHSFFGQQSDARNIIVELQSCSRFFRDLPYLNFLNLDLYFYLHQNPTLKFYTPCPIIDNKTMLDPGVTKKFVDRYINTSKMMNQVGADVYHPSHRFSRKKEVERNENSYKPHALHRSVRFDSMIAKMQYKTGTSICNRTCTVIEYFEVFLHSICMCLPGLSSLYQKQQECFHLHFLSTDQVNILNERNLQLKAFASISSSSSSSKMRWIHSLPFQRLKSAFEEFDSFEYINGGDNDNNNSNIDSHLRNVYNTWNNLINIKDNFTSKFHNELKIMTTNLNNDECPKDSYKFSHKNSIVVEDVINSLKLVMGDEYEKITHKYYNFLLLSQKEKEIKDDDINLEDVEKLDICQKYISQFMPNPLSFDPKEEYDQETAVLPYVTLFVKQRLDVVMFQIDPKVYETIAKFLVIFYGQLLAAAYSPLDYPKKKITRSNVTTFLSAIELYKYNGHYTLCNTVPHEKFLMQGLETIRYMRPFLRYLTVAPNGKLRPRWYSYGTKLWPQAISSIKIIEDYHYHVENKKNIEKTKIKTRDEKDDDNDIIVNILGHHLDNLYNLGSNLAHEKMIDHQIRQQYGMLRLLEYFFPPNKITQRPQNNRDCEFAIINPFSHIHRNRYSKQNITEMIASIPYSNTIKFGCIYQKEIKKEENKEVDSKESKSMVNSNININGCEDTHPYYQNSILFPTDIILPRANNNNDDHNNLGTNFNSTTAQTQNLLKVEYSDGKEFALIFQKFSHGLFNNFNWSNVVIAGGSVQKCIVNDFPDCEYVQQKKLQNKKLDIDIFLYGLSSDQAKIKIKEIIIHLLVKNKAFTLSESKHSSDRSSTLFTSAPVAVVTSPAITINLLPSIQIVLRLYRNISEILLGFDIDSCCFAWDGQNVWALPRAIRSLLTKCNVVDFNLRSTTYVQRLLKYSTRGFQILVPGLHLPFACLPTYFNLGGPCQRLCDDKHSICQLLKYHLKYMDNYDAIFPNEDSQICYKSKSKLISKYILKFDRMLFLFRKGNTMLYKGKRGKDQALKKAFKYQPPYFPTDKKKSLYIDKNKNVQYFEYNLAKKISSITTIKNENDKNNIINFDSDYSSKFIYIDNTYVYSKDEPTTYKLADGSSLWMGLVEWLLLDDSNSFAPHLFFAEMWPGQQGRLTGSFKPISESQESWTHGWLDTTITNKLLNHSNNGVNRKHNEEKITTNLKTGDLKEMKNSNFGSMRGDIYKENYKTMKSICDEWSDIFPDFKIKCDDIYFKLTNLLSPKELSIIKNYLNHNEDLLKSLVKFCCLFYWNESLMLQTNPLTSPDTINFKNILESTFGDLINKLRYLLSEWLPLATKKVFELDNTDLNSVNFSRPLETEAEAESEVGMIKPSIFLQNIGFASIFDFLIWSSSHWIHWAFIKNKNL